MALLMFIWLSLAAFLTTNTTERFFALWVATVIGVIFIALGREDRHA